MSTVENTQIHGLGHHVATEASTMHNPIDTPRADVIRERFLSVAKTNRDAAARMPAGVDRDALLRAAESQERMAAKRYEAMKVRAI